MKQLFLTLVVLSVTHVNTFAGDGEDLKARIEIVVLHPDRENAQRNCREAISRGDLRFVAIYGMVISLPGVDSYDPRFPLGVKIIKDTGDYSDTPERQAFLKSAEIYARNYNKFLLDYLASRKKGGKKKGEEGVR